jgi:mannose-6-phosphate isomerase-like protein (cupin superfamily)
VNALQSLQGKLELQGYQVTLHLLAPGTAYGAYRTSDVRIDAVFAGQLKVVVGGASRLLGPGDWMEIPAGVMMSAEVVGEDPVFALDAARE